MRKRATSRDVARLAGVSQASVSLALSGKAGVSDATRRRVEEVAAELNYRPNLAARSMRTNRTGRLVVVLPVATAMNPMPLLEGAITTAEQAGYSVELVSLPGGPKAREERVHELIDAGQHEGILSFTRLGSAPATGETSPAILSLTEFDDSMRASGELTDASPIDGLMDGLAQLGHRRFLHIAGASSYPTAVARADAYLAAIGRLGAQSLGVVGDSWDPQSGYDAIAALDDDAPLAVIAANDMLATGAIRAAAARGWSIPGDMSITGWDDADSSAFLRPSLTSVVQERELLGGYSMQRLIAMLQGGPEPTHPDGFQHIVWRESTAPPAPSRA
ncbi:LacI family DNA-binding transcriptional regulator [Microbacterium karelineae]|uniref:LacI family DNA-binding transcriptional regulator n=1 Tax=Microbacterium karelineae TaxID=2654283 RepID=UPI0018D47309|nr:LacI family DNA-binding transcriptional regulator [Microbacterium karelineae]